MLQNVESTRRSTKRFGTRRYLEFICDLRTALTAPQSSNNSDLLNGTAGQKCLDLISPHSLQVLGAFFTPSEIAERLISGLKIDAWEKELAFDPSCGAADLLLPIARRLPVRRTVSATLRDWNKRISGCDLSQEFIEAARLRIMLLAVERGATLDGSPAVLAKLLSNLTVGDGLVHEDCYRASSCIVMNPPYGRVASGVLSWKSGMVTAAALFVDRAVRFSTSGTRIAALLPEVLRTGTSYKHWRSYVEKFASKSSPVSVGQFSAHADVDVFIQFLIKRATPKSPNSVSFEPNSQQIR